MSYEVTIGIPVYRAEAYIARALESALSQSYASVEFLIVDDAGGDRSMAIVADFQQNHLRGKDIRVVRHQENQGVSASRNDIIREARGEYLYFMDSDDAISADTITLLMQAIRRFQAEMAFGSYERIDVSGVRSVYQYPSALFLEKDQLAAFAFRKYAGIQASACNYLVRTSLLREKGLAFIDTDYWEDMVFTYRLVTHVTKAILLPDITYSYYCRENSLSHYQQRATIGKDEVMRNVKAVDCLKADAATLRHKAYYPDWCYNLVMTDFYIACTILKRRNSILPPVTDGEIKRLMAHPATFRQVCAFQKSRMRNMALLLLGKFPPFLCVCAIKMMGKVKKLT